MEELPNTNSDSGTTRERNTNNIAQRLSRQLSRTILPALRNLVRTNRSSPSSSPSSTSTSTSPLPLRSPSSSPSLSSPFASFTHRRGSRVAAASSSPVSSPSLPASSSLSRASTSSPSLHRTTTSSQSPSLPTTQSPHTQSIESLLDALLPIPTLPPQSPTTEHTNNNDPATVADNNTGLQIVNSFGALATTLANNLRDNENASSYPHTTNAADAMDTTNTNGRQRYRLVVYFEERSPEEHPTARYVAVIVGRLDELQLLLSSNNTSERGFSDMLNNLFNSYAPKGTPPASKNIIDTLPTVTINNTEQSCMICLENFVEGSTAVVLPCKHMFHGEECVKSWLKLHNSCPICRYELPVDDPEYETERKQRMTSRGFHESDEHAHDHDHTHEHDLAHDRDVDMLSTESDIVLSDDCEARSS